MSDQTSIYIHIPFCVKKCIYCDFYSQTHLGLIPGYVTALAQEIKQRSAGADKISTIYFGGGTPSLLGIKDIDLLLQTIEDRFCVSRSVEVSMEVNPGTVDLNYLKELTRIGINRLSIGIQSFNDEKLQFLGRIHTAKQGIKAIEDAGSAGFDSISLDLMYGLSFEARAMWQTDLRQATAAAPSHLSCYMLTIEKGTPLHDMVKQGRIDPLDSRAISSLFIHTSRFLEGAGYDHYEISSFSKGEKSRSRHNSNYWNMTPYYGFGAAARSYDGERTRSWNHCSIDDYIRDMTAGRRPVAGRETLTREQRIMETIMLRLRSCEGLDIKKFNALFELSFEHQFGDILHQITDASLGYIRDNYFALTLEGRARLDSIVEALIQKIY